MRFKYMSLAVIILWIALIMTYPILILLSVIIGLAVCLFFPSKVFWALNEFMIRLGGDR